MDNIYIKQYLSIEKSNLKLHRMVLHKNSLTSLQEDISSVETKKETVSDSKKKKSLLRITFIKVKIFFWHLSPIHWYDGFKEIKIDLSEFECKQTKKQ